jgi:hypothetical protein
MILQLDQGRSPIGRLDTFLRELDPVCFSGVGSANSIGCCLS